MPPVRRKGGEDDICYRIQPERRWLVQYGLLPQNRGAQTRRLRRRRMLRRLTGLRLFSHKATKVTKEGN